MDIWQDFFVCLFYDQHLVLILFNDILLNLICLFVLLLLDYYSIYVFGCFTRRKLFLWKKSLFWPIGLTHIWPDLCLCLFFLFIFCSWYVFFCSTTGNRFYLFAKLSLSCTYFIDWFFFFELIHVCCVFLYYITGKYVHSV